MEDMNLQVQESRQAPSSMNTKKNSLKHIMVKLMENEDKEKILEEAGVKRPITFKKGKKKITIMTYSREVNTKPEGNGIASLKS